MMADSDQKPFRSPEWDIRSKRSRRFSWQPQSHIKLSMPFPSRNHLLGPSVSPSTESAEFLDRVPVLVKQPSIVKFVPLP